MSELAATKDASANERGGGGGGMSESSPRGPDLNAAAVAAATGTTPTPAAVHWRHGAEVLPSEDFYVHHEEEPPDRHSCSRPTMEQLLSAKAALPSPAAAKSEDEEEKKKKKEKKPVKFGWVEGVYMRCLLNIWGVMLFLRLTWVVGQAGLMEGLLLITLSNIVTLITAISMSAVSTNGQIGAGGIYYMISRSLGPEFGGAIGLMFTLANSIAVSMYTIGFCEALWDMLKQYVTNFDGIVDSGRNLNDIRLIGTVTLVLVLGLAVVGMEWVTRVQMALLVLLVISQVDFLVGSFLPPKPEQEAKGFVGYSVKTLSENLASSYSQEDGNSQSFFTVFAVFFPAVTGIVAGANLSGDLKSPGVAIPKGTLLAIATTYLSYVIYAVIIASCSIRKASGDVKEVGKNVTLSYNSCSDRVCNYGLSQSQQMMEVISAWGPLIYAGCFAATLSSAIASLVGAPRVFQAVAKDRLFPGIESFSKGYGSNNDPVRGYILVFIISLICILIGDLNVVSSLLSNFFVAAYALINFSVFHGDITNSPGWRPAFRYYNKWLSLLGTLLCVIVMFLMDYITALVTFICISFLYMYVSIRAPNVNWGSSTQSQSFMVALQAVQALSKVEDHVKNYRPKIILFCGNPGDRPTIIDFARLFTKKRSLLQCVRIIDRDLDVRRKKLAEDMGRSWFEAHRVKAFFHVNRADGFADGVKNALELSGLGKMKPNTMLLGFKANWARDVRGAEDYFQALRTGLDFGLALGLLRIEGGLDTTKIYSQEELIGGLGKSFHSQDKNSSDSDGDTTEDEDDNEGDGDDFGVKIKGGKRSAQNDSAPAPGASIPLLPLSMLSNPLNPQHRKNLARLRQFRGNQRIKNGTIDVYWLYDDGGLTILLPHLLKSTLKFSKCPLRVFVLPQGEDSGKAVQEESKIMGDMLTRFRIEVMTVAVLKDIVTHPSRQSEEEFGRILAHAQERTLKKVSRIQSAATAAASPSASAFFSHHYHHHHYDHQSPHLLTEEDLRANQDRTTFHLRLSEVVREKSSEAAAVFMTLPLPGESTPSALYLAWLDVLSRKLPPFLFVRGNQESVLTFYS